MKEITMRELTALEMELIAGGDDTTTITVTAKPPGDSSIPGGSYNGGAPRAPSAPSAGTLNQLTSDLRDMGHTVAQQQAAMKATMQSQYGGNSDSFIENAGGHEVSTSLYNNTITLEMQNGDLYFDEGGTGYINGMATPSGNGYAITDGISTATANLN